MRVKSPAMHRSCLLLFLFLVSPVFSIAFDHPQLPEGLAELRIPKLGSQIDLSLLEPLKDRANLGDKQFAERVAILFEKGHHAERVSLFQLRNGGKTSSDVYRSVVAEGVEAEADSLNIRITETIHSQTFDTLNDNRIGTGRFMNRTYRDRYRIKSNGNGGVFSASLSTESDSLGSQSTRQGSTARAYLLKDLSLVVESTSDHPGLYRGEKGERQYGVNVTRSSWQWADGVFSRKTESITFATDKEGLFLGAKLNEFRNLKSQTYSSFDPPAAKHWRVVTDATERGGESTIKVGEIASGVVLEGKLGSLKGKSGPVGFALARVPFLSGKTSLGLELKLRAETAITVNCVVQTDVNSLPGVAGKVTYQRNIVLRPGKDVNRLSLPWSEFAASVRGRKQIAPPLALEKIKSVAFLFARGSQEKELREKEDLSFRLELFR